MTGQSLALLITGLSHVCAAVILVVMLVRLGGSRPQDLRDWWEGDDGGEGGSPDGSPKRGPGGDGIPLPDAQASSVRLRGPGAIAGAFNAPRRPPHRRPVPERDSEPTG
ncbi:unannotated protein [freshwater metagenome]|uniref:Unannotated protein n=1 Tax=freshwater metagenome TaxID=449393 RepID=A0A6J5Z9I6_9ZZZZ|nr:hypothetical protein [Actinomycetota bacterium]